MDGASAIIAIGSIAIQLADSLQKLIEFWKTVQDAPSKVAALFAELECLSGLLAQIRKFDPGGDLTRSTVWVLSDCTSKISGLQKIIRRATISFQAPGSSRKKWAAFKITLKKTEIDALRGSLDRAKSTLQQILSLSIQSDLRSQREINLRILQLVEPPGSSLQIPEHNVGQKKYEVIHTSTTDFVLLLWPMQSWSVSRKVTSAYSRGTRSWIEKDHKCVLYPTELLSKLGISYGLWIQAKFTVGWQFSIHPLNIIPAKSAIFEFCRDGNVSGVETLLRLGQASVHDRDPLGRTPLWIAAQSLQLDAAEFLLGHGADTHAYDWRRGCPPIGAITYNSELDIGKRIAMVDLLQSYSSELYEQSTITRILGYCLAFYHPLKELELSLADRNRAALQMVIRLLPNFAPDDILRSHLIYDALRMHYDQDVIRWVARNIRGPLHESDAMSIVHMALVKKLLLRDPASMKIIMEKTPNLHHLWDPSGLSSIPTSTPTSLTMYQPAMFLAWRSILQEIGTDMKDFILRELEEHLLAKLGWNEQSLTSLFNFDFGPSTVPNQGAFVRCERCGSTEDWRWVKIDLDWRRQLRDFRKGRSPAKANTHGPHHAPPIPRSFPQHLQNARPYSMVCSDSCMDGVCIAWAYENDTDDEPQLPLYDPDWKDKTKSWAYEIDTTEECPTKKMPGAFPND